ncbi:RNA polymerase sigma factor [Aureicoccus marinus]|jgi:RNA polymerase sigma-70 factor (ECF subfamily)|uniref:Uncharacterized protein n=1 Tax=Aureicoccus marinus TaxID=754435 RepID=A0A2S7T9A8_9FLAO|nr:RNA polymerase sigma factor [Aureicoccus marinus]PQJ16056.1 hypothetical protein BST99_10260 [Aureicoccus marinus]
MEKKEAQLQKRLRDGDRKALEQVYIQYKDAFVAYLSDRVIVRDQLEDLYQDTVVSLFQNFVLKQLELESSSIKTYLFAIGKNKAAAHFRGPQLVSREEIEPKEAIYQIEKENLSEEQLALKKAFERLSDSCRQLLRLHYYRGLTDKEIKKMTDYKDINTIKSSRSRCLKKLKSLIHE